MNQKHVPANQQDVPDFASLFELQSTNSSPFPHGHNSIPPEITYHHLDTPFPFQESQPPFYDGHYQASDSNPPSRLWFDDHNTIDVDSRDVPDSAPAQRSAPAPAAAPTAEAELNLLPALVKRRDYGEVQFQEKAPPKSNTAIRIARSMKGDIEVSLISERENGEHVRYAIEIKNLYAHKCQRVVLIEDTQVQKKGEVETQMALEMPLTLDKANIVFDEAVLHQFPPAKLRNSERQVPTHVILL